MPSADAILESLQRIANEAFPLAVVWHVLVLAAIAAYSLRPRASRIGAMLASVPFASVSALAWAFGNPFNGAVFAVLSATLALLAWRAPAPESEPRPRWAVALGALALGFAWSYPHFLVGRSAAAYLVGAPMGLIPCPTLALVIGLALSGVIRPGRAWSYVLAGVGVVYALIGVLRLGVLLDLPLLAVALGLVVAERRTRPVRAAT